MMGLEWGLDEGRAHVTPCHRWDLGCVRVKGAAVLVSSAPWGRARGFMESLETVLGDTLWVSSRVLVQGQRECQAGIAGMLLAGQRGSGRAGRHPGCPARSAGAFLGQGFWGRGSPRPGGVSPHPQPCRAALSSRESAGAARWSLCPSVHPSGLSAVHLSIRPPLRPSVRSRGDSPGARSLRRGAGSAAGTAGVPSAATEPPAPGNSGLAPGGCPGGR